MDVKSVNVELPLPIYRHLEQIAKASGWPIEEVVLQAIRAGLPPNLSKVPEDFHEDLVALNKMNDRDLMRVYEGKLPGKKLDERRRKADFETLRRTYALYLLKWRGHPIPSPYELATSI
jgi:hypothetical protein